MGGRTRLQKRSVSVFTMRHIKGIKIMKVHIGTHTVGLNNILAIMVICTGFLMQGCAPIGWQHSYKGQAEFGTDKYQCENNAARVYPPALAVEQVADGYRTPVQTNCKKFKDEVRCTTYGGDYVQPVMSTVDTNEINRGSLFSSCMQSLGWEWKSVESGSQQRVYR